MSTTKPKKVQKASPLSNFERRELIHRLDELHCVKIYYCNSLDEVDAEIGAVIADMRALAA